MNAREWRLSGFFIVFVAFKVAEAALHLESWPASSVSMFSGYRPPQFVPLRARLVATRAGATVELGHHDFALSEDEFQARLHPNGGVAVRCGKLVASYNRTRSDPASRLEYASVSVEPVARPGRWNDVVPWTVRCVVPGEPVVSGEPRP